MLVKEKRITSFAIIGGTVSYNLNSSNKDKHDITLRNKQMPREQDCAFFFSSYRSYFQKFLTTVV